MLRLDAMKLTATLMALALVGVPVAAQEAEELTSDHSEAVTPQPVCELPPLPVPHANNAVVSVKDGDDTWLYSFLGLKSGKTHNSISKQAWRLKVGDSLWQRLDDVPVPQGRLASTAQVMDGKIYLIGGYSVADDGSEKSEPEVLVLDPETLKWQRIADMLVPVDDAVSFVYQDRYLYLVSGWHDVGNVNYIHVYDRMTDKWERATDFAGKAVFGHAGGIVDNKFVIADGVAVTGIKDGRRQFGMWAQGWQGDIDPVDPLEIQWTMLPALPGDAQYRMAAMGDDRTGRVVFAGGSTTAYNYDGTGYDGTPAEPSGHVYAWNIPAKRWDLLEEKKTPTMDHRGLVRIGDGYWTVGGMVADQTVTGAVLPAWNVEGCE